MMEDQTINNMADLLNYFGAYLPQDLNHRIYKDTECGASISVQLPPMTTNPDEFGDLPEDDPYDPPVWVHDDDPAWQYLTRESYICAFTIQTIVEGSDATVDSPPFVLPVSAAEVEQWIEDMESAEADYLWKEANLEETCDECGEFLSSDEEMGEGLCHTCLYENE